ncbi:MAG UNVERIFIED_CONTAM: NAD(P)H-binding protein, partial [Thermobifida fusca]
PLVRLAFAPQYADLAEMEEELAASGLDWTVVRPPRLLDGPGTYRSALGSNVPNGTSITRADLARALLDMLTNDATVGQVVGVAQ